MRGDSHAVRLQVGEVVPGQQRQGWYRRVRLAAPGIRPAHMIGDDEDRDGQAGLAETEDRFPRVQEPVVKRDGDRIVGIVRVPDEGVERQHSHLPAGQPRNVRVEGGR